MARVSFGGVGGAGPSSNSWAYCIGFGLIGLRLSWRPRVKSPFLHFMHRVSAICGSHSSSAQAEAAKSW
eukprot:465338-Pyramimonas_sp.AAC.1